MIARRESAHVARVYPQWVDVGAFEPDHAVRYERERGFYDLRDALQAAYGNDRAWRTTSKGMGKNFGLNDEQFTRIKWSDESSTGIGRILTSPKDCASIIRSSVRLHKRTQHLGPETVAHWFETQADCSTQPEILPALLSAHGTANQHSPSVLSS